MLRQVDTLSLPSVHKFLVEGIVILFLRFTIVDSPDIGQTRSIGSLRCDKQYQVWTRRA